jgi:hypothetical protein
MSGCWISASGATPIRVMGSAIAPAARPINAITPASVPPSMMTAPAARLARSRPRPISWVSFGAMAGSNLSAPPLISTTGAGVAMPSASRSEVMSWSACRMIVGKPCEPAALVIPGHSPSATVLISAISSTAKRSAWCWSTCRGSRSAEAPRPSAKPLPPHTTSAELTAARSQMQRRRHPKSPQVRPYRPRIELPRTVVPGRHESYRRILVMA